MSLVRLARRPARGDLLCRLDELSPDLGVKRLLWLEADGPRRVMILRRGAEAFAYWNECPHHGVALEGPSGDCFTPDRTLLQCSFHGAQFRFEDGFCVAGPCRGRSLRPFPASLRDGEVRAS